MSIEEVTLKQLKTHIKRRYNKGQSYNLLGFLENKDLDPEVEALFICRSYQYGARYYDWVNGNDWLRSWVGEIEKECRVLKGTEECKHDFTDDSLMPTPLSKKPIYESKDIYIQIWKCPVCKTEALELMGWDGDLKLYMEQDNFIWPKDKPYSFSKKLKK